MADADASDLIGPVLRKWLAPSGLKRFTIRSGEDHHGDPSLFIEAYFRGKGQDVDAEALIEAISEIRDGLLARGDGRHPYIRPRVPDAPRSEAA